MFVDVIYILHLCITLDFNWWIFRPSLFRPYTSLNLNSRPLTWSPSHIEKGETMLFLWEPHIGAMELEPGTHAWLARQYAGALPIRHVLFSRVFVIAVLIC